MMDSWTHQVHQRVKCPPEDLLREDDRHLAPVQPHHTLCRGDLDQMCLSSLKRFCYKRTSSTCAVLWRTRRRSTTMVGKWKLTSICCLIWSLQSPKSMIWSKWAVTLSNTDDKRYKPDKFSAFFRFNFTKFFQTRRWLHIVQDFKWKTVFNQRGGAAGGTEGLLWKVFIHYIRQDF